MRFFGGKDANDPVQVKPLNPREKRDLSNPCEGDMEECGYRLVARRPFGAMSSEMLDKKEAERMEKFLGDLDADLDL